MLYYTRYTHTRDTLNVAINENKALVGTVSRLEETIRDNSEAMEKASRREKALRKSYESYKNQVRDKESQAWRDTLIPNPELERLRAVWGQSGRDKGDLHSANSIDGVYSNTP